MFNHRQAIAILALLAAFVLTLPLRASMPSEVTKTSPTQFNIPAEVAAFYRMLIVDNPPANAAFAKLVEASRSPEGSAARTSQDVIPVEWLVEKYTRIPGNGDDQRAITNSTSTYLTIQSIYNPFSHGLTASANAVAQFKVKYHAVENPDPQHPGETKLTENSLTITFQGFVTLTPKPIIP